MTAARTRRTDGEIDTTQVENRAEIHVDGRVHGLENQSRAKQLRIVLGKHCFMHFDGRFGRTVVAEKNAHFVVEQVVVGNTGLVKRFAGCHVGIRRFLGQTDAQTTVQQGFQIGLINNAGQRTAEAVFAAGIIHADAAASVTQTLVHFGGVLADA